MTDTQLLDLAYKMRQAQKAYFKNRLHRDLNESKELERTVDYEFAKRKGTKDAPTQSTGNLFGR